MEINTGFNELTLVYICLLLGVGVVIFMFTQIFKLEDERRKTIIEKASTLTFMGYVVIVLIDFLSQFINFVPLLDHNSSFFHLTLISVMFSINLFMAKRKFGDYCGE